MTTDYDLTRVVLIGGKLDRWLADLRAGRLLDADGRIVAGDVRRPDAVAESDRRRHVLHAAAEGARRWLWEQGIDLAAGVPSALLDRPFEHALVRAVSVALHEADLRTERLTPCAALLLHEGGEEIDARWPEPHEVGRWGPAAAVVCPRWSDCVIVGPDDLIVSLRGQPPCVRSRRIDDAVWRELLRRR